MTYLKGTIWVLLFNLGFCAVLFCNCRSDRASASRQAKSILANEVESPTQDTLIKQYNFEEASEVFVLSYELTEISGLSFNKGSNSLFAVNDERGLYYELSAVDGNVLTKTNFYKSGDYEGIEYLEGQMVVAKSNGTLYFYDLFTKETEVIKTGLTATNDVEGLAYDPQERLLLVACKGQSNNLFRKKTVKSIYGFSLDSFKLVETPVLDVFDDELIEFAELGLKDQSKSELKKYINRVKSFSPSGIAINPKNNHVYILSARGSTLIVLDDRYNIHDIIFLNPNVIPQPEGICFDFDANLYISTEGQGFSGKLFKYNYQKQ